MQIVFPPSTDVVINMMPIVMGDVSTLPSYVQSYESIISKCDLPTGDVVYLTVHESWVPAGETQRRPGIHTDGTRCGAWGDGSWGSKGIWMASTDGDCLIWPEEVDAGDVDDHGALLRELDTTPVRAQSNWLHHLSDRTPHASIAATQAHYRQFFRLVGPNIFGWYLQHSTPNPLGVLPGPGVPIIHTSKF